MDDGTHVVTVGEGGYKQKVGEARMIHVGVD